MSLVEKGRVRSELIATSFWEARRLVAVLELTNISKHFGAIQAVNDVSFSLEAGQVVGLMGDNGAGKSTLVKMIAGNFRPSHGTMRLDGAEIVLHRPKEAREHGIEIVHQDLALCKAEENNPNESTLPVNLIVRESS